MMNFLSFKEESMMSGWDQGHKTLTVSRAGLVNFIQTWLATFPFEEDWYLATYPDVAEEVKNGRLENGRQHYLQFGYFEGRLPGLAAFDHAVYLNSYDDLRKFLDQKNAREIAIEHFVKYGYREGRFYTSRPLVKRDQLANR